MAWLRLCVTRSVRWTRSFAAVPAPSAGNETLQQRPETALVKSGKAKVQALAVDGDPGRPAQLQTLAQHLRKGTLSLRELLDAVRRGAVTQRDLEGLKDMKALSSTKLRHIRRILWGGTPQLSISEIMALLKAKLLGTDDFRRILKKGDVTSEDLEFLVGRNLLPRDVKDVLVGEIDGSAQTNTSLRGYGRACMGLGGRVGVRTSLKSADVPRSRLGTFVMSGDLHPDDLSLLVEEGLLTDEEREKILQKCGTEVAGVYEEAEKFAELVQNGRFTEEELEVMRAKGVLGDALVHYLVQRDAIDDVTGRRILEIEQDAEYLDPEETDEEIESSVPRQNYKPEASPSVLGQGGASDEGFYPEGLDKEDTFGLWEYLDAVYAHRPGKEDPLEIVRQTQAAVGLSRRPGSIGMEELPALRPQIDGEGRAFGVGKRKASVAQICLRKGTGQITVNDKCFRDYFASLDGRCYVISPFLATQTLGTFDVAATVQGGGWSGQAQAIRHGIACALRNFDPELDTPLRRLGLLKHDARTVERKKPGRAKARKSFQWVKR